MRSYDVLVVGAGPAGSALATSCAGRGQRVLLLDRAEFPRPKVCGDYVSAKGLSLLARLGCLDDVRAKGYTPVRRAEAVVDGAWLCGSRIPFQPGMVRHAHTIPRDVLDEILLRRAVAAGADTALGCRVRSFETGPRGVRVEAERNGHRERFEAPLLVGADGAHSIVARCVGMPMRDPRYRLHALRAYCHGLTLDHAVMSFEERYLPGYAWIFPIRPGLANVGVGLVAETSRRFGLDLREFYQSFVATVERKAVESGKRLAWEQPVGFPIHTYGGAGANFFERGLLIGEAGCFVDPMSGEGIPLAIETALLAADVIDEAFREGDFSSEFLSRYEHAWRARYESDLGLSDLLLALTRNRHLVKVWMQALRLVGETARDDPGYAWTMGGVLGGIFPHSRALAPQVLSRSFAHGPAFWRRFLGISGSTAAPDLARLGASYARWGIDSFFRTAADAPWVGGWWAEVTRKQRHVLAAMVAAPPGGSPGFPGP